MIPRRNAPRPIDERYRPQWDEDGGRDFHSILDRLDEQTNLTVQEIYEWVQDTFVAWHCSDECRERSEENAES